MLVDNRDEFIEKCAPELEKSGFNVAVANSYNEALQKFSVAKPDVVITALMLEHYDSGFVLSYKLKKENPDVLIYILTSATHTTGIKFSLNSEEEKEWIKADGFLNEPIKPEDLIELVRRHLSRKKEPVSAQ
jgi:CheY-like chemotaxis protein